MRRGTAPQLLGGALLLLAAQQASARLGAAPRHGAAAAAAAGAPTAAAPLARQADSAFGRLVERLSEPGGYFDTDNLISNERSYLHAVGKLRSLRVSGGAYIGVGPDQNFSYIAHVRPRVAFIIDIRRDNLLQHLLFKALFARARNRLEYLCLLTGRPLPPRPGRWDRRDVEQLVAHLDRTPADRAFVERTRAALLAEVRRAGVPLTPSDLETVARIHESFVADGLDLRFTSHGRAARPYYPTLRDLILERDLDGRRASYLASEADFRFVKQLQARGLVVPVVGDLAGPHAMAAIASEIARRGERVSAFYTSNVEFYLMRDGGFERFAENVARLPRDARSVIVRSYFGGPYRRPHPHAVPGYTSAQLLQPVERFLAEHARGGLASYWELVTRDAL